MNENLEAARRDLEEAESRAGLSEKIADAKLGVLIPDPSWSSTEYHRWTDDHVRSAVRSLYSGVADLVLRKELISKRRSWERSHGKYRSEQTLEARREFAEARERAGSQLPFFYAAGVAILCVVIGAQWFHLYGAIAGALAGFFLGQSTIMQQRKVRAAALSTTEDALKENLADSREESLRPDWFNEAEERTGERDLRFDDESALANAAKTERQVATHF